MPGKLVNNSQDIIYLSKTKTPISLLKLPCEPTRCQVAAGGTEPGSQLPPQCALGSVELHFSAGLS